MKRLIFTLSATAFLLLVSAIENRFLFGMSSVHPGMTQEEVFQKLGQPEFYETETDNWYFLKFYPFLFGAVNVKIDMRDFMSVISDGTPGNGRTGDYVTSIEWKRAFCLDTKENIHRLSH
jgi:hypothetical protein